MTVLDYLRDKGIQIEAPCGGNGTCGKCLVTVDGGAPLLACRTEYREGSEIKIAGRSAENSVMDILGLGGSLPLDEPAFAKGYRIAIDIGTTTIAGVLFDASTGGIISQSTRINSNRRFGADVISRIKAAGEGHGDSMRSSLLRDIQEICLELSGDHGKISADTIAIAGNTTMIHTLMGYDLTPLGSYPYTPENTDLIQEKAGDIFGEKTNDTIIKENSHGVIFPGVSAFIGGDIVSGVFYLETLRKANSKTVTDDIYALMDLGTNGEIAIITPDVIYCASTAAGPVFEGGGISCGSASITGAIDHLKIDHRGITYTMIGSSNKTSGLNPAGICGSGIIDCASEIFRSGLCDKRGTFVHEGEDIEIGVFPDGRRVSFTQDDMRQVQMAKAAVAAGFEILLQTANLRYEDIKTLYLAGGFGYSLDPESSCGIGLIDSKLKDRIIPAGNTSLKGAVMLASYYSDQTLKDIDDIRRRCRNTDLASDPSFEKLYISHMDLIRQQ